jgi:hypothetical protein
LQGHENKNLMKWSVLLITSEKARSQPITKKKEEGIDGNSNCIFIIRLL